MKTLPEKSDVHGDMRCVKSLPGKGGAQGSRHGRTKVEILQDIADLQTKAMSIYTNSASG